METTERMVFELTSGGYLVIVHTFQEPSKEAWDRYVALCKEKKSEIRGFAVFTQGGGPDAKQRATAGEIWMDDLGKLPPTTVMTSSRLVRGIVTAMNWAGAKNVRAFPPHQTHDGLRHLGVPNEHVGEVLFCANRLLKQLNSTMLLSA